MNASAINDAVHDSGECDDQCQDFVSYLPTGWKAVSEAHPNDLFALVAA